MHVTINRVHEKIFDRNARALNRIFKNAIIRIVYARPWVRARARLINWPGGKANRVTTIEKSVRTRNNGQPCAPQRVSDGKIENIKIPFAVTTRPVYECVCVAFINTVG